MFVTLAGGYPRRGTGDSARSPSERDDRDDRELDDHDRDGDDHARGRDDHDSERDDRDDRERDDRAVDAVLAELAAIGLEPLSDGEVRWADPLAAIALRLDGLEAAPKHGSARGAAAPPSFRAARMPSWRAPITVEDWRYAASRTGQAVKQAIVGPYSIGRRVDPAGLGRHRVTRAIAEALNSEIRALSAAGCPLVEVHEDAAVEIGEDEGERRLFVEAQRRLLEGIAGDLHCMLAIRGGSADTAGASTVLDPPYRSYLFDLITGPDNWRLAADVPADRGIVCGVMDVRPRQTMGVEELIFAARYAASTRGRGLVRVGLAPAGSLAHLEPADARSRLELLVRAAELAASSPDEIGRSIDPRAVDIRSAALGRYAPARRHAPGPAGTEVRKDGGGPIGGPGMPRTDGNEPGGDQRR